VRAAPPPPARCSQPRPTGCARSPDCICPAPPRPGYSRASEHTVAADIRSVCACHRDMTVRWANIGVGECIDNDGDPPKTGGHTYPHGPAPALTTLLSCKAACVKGQALCAGINWLPDGGGHGPGQRCMIQTKKGPSQAQVEKAIGSTLSAWWDASDPSLPMRGVWNHANGDWVRLLGTIYIYIPHRDSPTPRARQTATATCWALQSGAGDHEDGLADGLGWSATALMLVGLLMYVGGGVGWGHLAGRGRGLEAHPHRKRWAALHGLVIDGVVWTRSKVLGGSRSAPLHSAPLLASSSSRAERSTSSEARKGKRKHKKKAAQKSPKGTSRAGALADGDEMAPAAMATKPASSTIAPPREWKPTRSVLLSSGARETGVKVEM
jgi:hypothetical protein